jgi:hypothetical protein
MKQDGKPSSIERQPKPSQPRRAMVGIRMTHDRETEVKVEAARRGVSVATLFDEIWQAYVRGKARLRQ